MKRHLYAAIAAGLLSVSPAVSELELMAQRPGAFDTVCEVRANSAPPRQRPKPAAPKPFRNADIQRAIQGSGIRNTVEGDKLNIYFRTSDWRLFANDTRDLNNYIKTMPPGSSFIVEGHADYRGTDQSNEQLFGRQRASGVAKIIRSYSGRPRVEVVSYGERFAKPEGTPLRGIASDRRVTIIPNKGFFTRGLEELPSDVYLIDQSSSMGSSDETGEPKWGQVQEYPYKSGSSVYTFSTDRRACGNNLSNEAPRGGTPLFESLYRLVNEIVPNGKTVTVLTDGDDTEGGDIEAIIKRAKEKKIPISFVGTGISDQYANTLMRIQKETGGGHYISQSPR